MRFLKIEYTKWWTQMRFFEIEYTKMESDVCESPSASCASLILHNGLTYKLSFAYYFLLFRD